jgi:MFS family permease
MMLGEGVMGVLYPVFVYQVLHGEALQIGELMSAQAVGGLFGGVLFGWVGRWLMSRWAIGLCQIAFGLLDLAIFNSPAFFPFFGVSVGLFIAVGIPIVGSSTGTQSLLQAAAPEAYRGRVFGALGTTIGLFGLLGTVAASAVTSSLGVVTVLNAQGIGQVLAGVLIIALLPARRNPTGLGESVLAADPATADLATREARPQ